MKDKQLVVEFILSESAKFINGGLEDWLADLLIKTKSEQDDLFQAWVDDQKTRTQAALDALEAQKIATQDQLNAKLTKLNAV